MRTWMLCCLLLALFAGCTDDEPAIEDLPDVPARNEGPETKPDTLLIEGQPEPVTAHLYDEEGVPFRFAVHGIDQ